MRHLFLMMACLMGLSLEANHHLTAEQALERLGLGYESAHTLRKAPAARNQRYYVFNREDGGFVIASADDRARAVLGYCDEGQWDPNNIPPAMQGWLESMTAALDILAESDEEVQVADNQQAISRRRAAATRVEPLFKLPGEGEILWGQNTPFNNLCPAIGNTHSATGCAATAMAQIMRYHKWPDHGYGSNTYDTSSVGDQGLHTTVSQDFSKTYYDWNNMLTAYYVTVDGKPNNYNEKQAEAVATLMRHVGVSFSMDYNTGASGTTEGPMLKGILENLNYDKGLQIYYRENYTSEEWYAMLQDEIDAKRPVLMNGYSLSGGHAFVIDGYDTSMGDSYFHFNWGWNGMSNGYYSVDVTDPGQQGTGGSLGGYSYNQNIFTGLQKPTGSNKSAQPNLCVSAAIRYQYGQIHFQFLNRGCGQFNGQAGYAIDKGNGNVQFVAVKSYSLGFREGSGSLHLTPVAPTAAGWHYYAAYKDGSDIVRMRTIVGTPSELISVSDGKGGYTLESSKDECSLTCLSFAPTDETIYAGTTAYFTLKLQNIGSAEYNGALYLTMSDMVDDGKGGYVEGAEERATENPLGIYLRPGASNTYAFPYYGGLTTGKHRVRVMYNPRNGGGLIYVANAELDIDVVPYSRPVKNPPSITKATCELSATEVEQGKMLTLSVVATNVGGTDEVMAGGCIYKEKGNTVVGVLGGKLVKFEKGENTLTFPGMIDLPVGRYRMLFGWQDDGWWELPNYQYIYFNVLEAAEGISTPTIQGSAAKSFDLQGRQLLNANSDMRGLYIQNGRKVIR